MNRSTLTILIGFLALAGFGAGAYFYLKGTADAPPPPPVAESSPLVRAHSPILGPVSARVTIAEFFDPACESCRALYPVVKEIMAAYPDDVRVVLRYTPFHSTSEEAIRILEAARIQDKFQPVLEALLDKQEEWSSHDGPDISRAWEIAGEMGVDLVKAKSDAFTPAVDAVIAQDVADVEAFKVKKTPTFFVNGRPLEKFGVQQLKDLVQQEVSATR